jgi:hypothetical protein
MRQQECLTITDCAEHSYLTFKVWKKVNLVKRHLIAENYYVSSVLRFFIKRLKILKNMCKKIYEQKMSRYQIKESFLI